MGFLDKVKELAIKAKCMTGFHAGEFSHINGKPLCHLEKTCPDCKKYLTDFKHSFSEWKYVAERSCLMQIECIHCGIQQEKTNHHYEVTDQFDSSCHRLHRCDRCDHVKPGLFAEHVTELVGHDPSCRPISRCQRCGQQVTGSPQHSWGGWSTAPGGHAIRTCARCGTQERKKS